METKEAIDKLKSDLAEIKAHGQDTIPIEGLENYLSGLEKDASASLESRKLDYQRILAGYDAQVKWDIELFKSVIEAGKEALNATLIINGGAVIAFLGFLGSMLSKGGNEALGLKLTIPLCSFGFGVHWVSECGIWRSFALPGGRKRLGLMLVAVLTLYQY